MKIVRFRKDGVVRLGVLTADEKGVIAMASVLPKTRGMELADYIRAEDEDDRAKLEKAAAAGSLFTPIPASETEILAPVERPDHDILCVGVNYRSHFGEVKKNDLDTPDESASGRPASIYFLKRALRIIGPGEAIEGRFDLDEELDYEAELAVIIGREGKDIPPEDAKDYIFGYSIFNDISSRKLQREHKQWLRGKSLDTYSAMGPCVVTRDSFAFPPELTLSCEVNGEVRQESNTSLFLNGIAGVIADLSAGMTLLPGDIISTGTPGGVAMGMPEPKWLKDGDVVTCRIEGIGELTNPVRDGSKR